MRLHHVNVVVPPGGTEGVVAFYELLGWARVPKTTGRSSGAWFALPDGTQLHVSERPGAVHPDAHVAVVVDDFDAVLAGLRATGRPWADAAEVDGCRRGHTADPAGNAVEVVEERR